MLRRELLAGVIATSLMRSAIADTVVTLLVPELPSFDTGALLSALQPELERWLDRPVIIDFRPGAGGMLGFAEGARAAPDGATLTLLAPALVLAPWLNQRMNCRPEDFAPLGLLASSPIALAVRDGSPLQSLPMLLRPTGQLTVAAPEDWSAAQLAQAVFVSRASLPVETVPGLASDAARIAALRAGTIDFAFLDLATARRHPSGLHLLALAADARVTDYPMLPTFRDLGTDLVQESWRMLAVPAATPGPVQRKIAGTLRKIADNPAFRAAVSQAGLQPRWFDADASRAMMMRDYRAAGRILAALGLNTRKDMLGS